MNAINKYEIAANITLADMDNHSGSMTYKQQREIFGVAIFGKKRFTVDNTGQGRIFGTYSCCGNDYAMFDITFEQLAERINRGFHYIS